MRETTKDKIDRRAVGELEYDEITDVFDLVTEQVRNKTRESCEATKSAAQSVRSLAEPSKP